MKKLLVIVSICFVLLYCFIALSRMDYPYDIEWHEGGSIEHIQRLIDAEQIYSDPNLEFIPFIYTPAYYYILLPFVLLFENAHFAIRLVSFISSLLAGLAIFLIVYQKSDLFSASVSLGLFLGTYQLTSFWFDVGRVDSLFLAFTLFSFFFMQKSNSKWAWCFAALLSVLALLTKQIYIVILFPMLFYIFMYKRQYALTYLATFLGLSSISLFYFNYISDGWFYFWLFELPASHVWNWEFIVLFWTYDLFNKLPIVLALGIVYFVYYWRERISSPLLFFGVAVILISWLSRLHYGGIENVLMPVYAFLAIIAGLATYELEKNFANNKSINKFVHLLLLIQFIALLYNPTKAIPTSQDIEAGNRLIEEIRAIDGEVIIPFHSNYFRKTEKVSPIAHSMVLCDLFASKPKEAEPLLTEFRNKIENKYYSAIIINEDWLFPEIELVKLHYEPKEIKYVNQKVFMTRSGLKTRPQWIYYPKNFVIDNNYR